MGEYLDELYRRYEQDPQLFARLLNEHLVHNRHRLTVTFLPDPALQTRRDAEFAATMAEKKAALAPADIARIVDEAAELEKRQNTPNTPDALATLPVLHLPDLPERPRVIPGELLTVAGGVPLLRNDVFANGVNYAVLALDLDGLPAELWELVPFFAEILAHVGAGKLDYVQMGQRIAGNTGGLGAELFTAVDALDPARVRAFLTISFKALDRTFPEALAIVRDLLLELDLSDTERLRDLVLQAKAQRQSGIIDSGHRFAAQHAGRHLSGLGHLNWVLGGLPQIRLAGQLAREFDQEIEKVRDAFHRIRRFLLDPRRMYLSFTGSNRLTATAAQWLEELVSAVPASRATGTGRGIPFAALPATGPEGLALASEVAFCALCLPAPPATAPEAPAVSVFSQLLSLGYLWEEIRAKGGAYGGFCSYDGSGQLFQMLSYRDPNIPRTLAVMRGVGEHLAQMDFSPAEIERAIISCAKNEERPIRPSAATSTALWRHLLRASDELRNERYQALLRVDGPAVRTAAASLLDQGLGAGVVCVLAGRPLLEAAGTKLPAALTIENVLEDGDEAEE